MPGLSPSERRVHEKLIKLRKACQEGKKISRPNREFLNHTFWHGSRFFHSDVIEILGLDPQPSDMPTIGFAAQQKERWTLRCDAAIAFGRLGDLGQAELRLMYQLEKHPLVRFYILRELIEFEDETCQPFLDGPIPPNSAPNRRSLWIYGNFLNERLSKHKALAYGRVLFQHKYRFHRWLEEFVDSKSD